MTCSPGDGRCLLRNAPFRIAPGRRVALAGSVPGN